MIRSKMAGALALSALPFLSFALPAAELRAEMSHHDGTAVIGDLEITGAAARASIGAAPNSAAYMTITTSGAPDRLIGGSTPAAEVVEIHEHRVLEGGAMVMMPVEGGIPVTPDAPAVLAPGGYHVMLIGLTGPMEDGSEISLTLTFETAGEVTLTVPVKSDIAHGHHGGHGAGH